jgi:hypothetical protein
MSTTVCWINDEDVETLGFAVAGLRGHADAVELPRDYRPIPGKAGGIMARHADVPARIIVIDLLLVGTTLTTRRESFRELEALCAGTCTLRFGDAPDQYVEGVLTRSPKRPAAPESAPWWTAAAPEMIASLEFTCATPAYFAVTENVVALSATAAALPMGTLPSAGVIDIGPSTNPVLTYKDADGTTQGTMGFTAVVASGDLLRVDLTEMRVTRRISGTWSAAQALHTSGAWLQPSPVDGDYTTEAWPTLAVSSGTASYTYRKAYRS